LKKEPKIFEKKRTIKDRYEKKGKLKGTERKEKGKIEKKGMAKK
jgi:hypothetical protein